MKYPHLHTIIMKYPHIIIMSYYYQDTFLLMKFLQTMKSKNNTTAFSVGSSHPNMTTFLSFQKSPCQVIPSELPNFRNSMITIDNYIHIYIKLYITILITTVNHPQCQSVTIPKSPEMGGTHGFAKCYVYIMEKHWYINHLVHELIWMVYLQMELSYQFMY